jgi:hypothetical protein
MINQIPKRVVLRKPKIKRPIDSKISKPIHITDQPQPEIQPIVKPVEPEILPVEPEIEIPEEQIRAIIKQKEEMKSPDIIFINTDGTTFDEKFLDNLDTKSRITKDMITLEKLQKQELKPTRTTKKKRRRLNIYMIISLITSGGLFLWMYKIITEYLNGQLDGSLASFMYVVAMGLLTIITFVWFCMELFKEDTL